MAQDFARAFYNSAAWRICRHAYITSVFCRCERCRKPQGYSGIVHHKVILTPENINVPAITLNWDNLEYNCQQCHNETHAGTSPLRDDVKFDDNGNLVKR